MSQVAKSEMFYGLDLDVVNMGVELRFNDIPIYYDNSPGQLKVELPVPEYVLNGKNKLKVRVFVPSNEDDAITELPNGAHVFASLFSLSNVSGEVEKKLTIADVKAEKVENTIIFSSPPLSILEKHEISSSSILDLEFEVEFDIDSPFPRWKWETGQIISFKDEPSLINTYEKIHSAFKGKKLSEIKNLYIERAEEIALAYGLDSIDAGMRKLSVGKDPQDERLQLFDMHMDGMSIEIFADGRLARLADSDRDQPIFFYQEDGGLLHLHKFIFYLNDKGNWVMIR